MDIVDNVEMDTKSIARDRLESKVIGRQPSLNLPSTFKKTKAIFIATEIVKGIVGSSEWLQSKAYNVKW
jgi:hypothetical protein